MAKKPPKGSKTDKVKIKDDMDLSEFGDLDDLGGEMSFGDEGDIDADNRTPSRAKVVKDLGKQAASGALDSIIKNAAKKSLPDEYSANYTDAMDIASFASEVVDKNKQALQKSTYKLGKEVKKILPFKVSLLDKYLEAQQSNFESARQQSEEEVRQAGIGSETAAIFDKQLEVQKSLYARTEAQGEVDRNASLVQGKLAQDVLANMDGNIAHQTAFITQISKEYYKRSLELQYKSFYVQADSLKTMREYYKAFSLQFTNIEKNTSLPDFVKLRTSESVKAVLRDQSVQKIYGNITDNSKYLQSVKKKISGMVDTKVQEVTSAMDGAASMLDMVNSSSEGTGSSAVGMLGGIGATMGGSVLGEKLAKMLPQKLIDKIKGNSTVKKGANYMGMLTSPSSLMEAGKEITARKAQENEDESTFGRKMSKKMFSGLNSFLQLATPEAESQEIKAQGYLTHDQPAIFDKNVHRSITEVIPMYLSKILQTNSELTHMYSFKNEKSLRGFTEKPGELVYDYEQRKLGSQQELNDNVKAKLFTNTAVAPKAKMVGSNILAQTYLDASKKQGADKGQLKALKKSLDKKGATEALAKYIEKGIASGSKVDFNTLVNKYRDDQKLLEMVEGDKKIAGLKELLDVLGANQVTDTKDIDARLSDIKRAYPIGPVKTALIKASEFSGALTKHVVSDEVADILSRVFTSYIQTTAKDVTPQSIITTVVFDNRLSAKDATPDVKEAIAELTYNLKKIESLSSGGDITGLDSAIRVTFSIMSTALRQGVDTESDVFKSLSSLSDKIIGNGKLSSKNTREGSLEIAKPEDYLTRTELADVANKKPFEIQASRSQAVENNLLDSMIKNVQNSFSGYKQDFLANKNNPTAMLDAMLNRVKEDVGTKSAELKAKADALASTISDLASAVADKTSAAVINKMSKSYAKAIVQMEDYTDTLKANLTSVVADMAVVQDVADSSVQETEKVQKSANANRVYKASIENSIRLLEATTVALKANKARIDSLKETMDKDEKGKVFAAVKEALAKAVEEMKGAIKQYENVGKGARV